MTDILELIARIEMKDERPKPPRCKDFDADCDDVSDKLHCWLYDPAKGFCPYLSEVKNS